MNRVHTSIIMFMLLLAACNTGKKKDPPFADPNPVDASVTGCYQFANAKDTIFLQLNHAGESVTGTLNYIFFEKDRNTGTIQGAMEGNLLIADYTFQSEGVVSVRQVVFKKEENGFIEGFGDINPNTEKQTFKDIHALQYDNASRLTEIDCRNW